MMLQLQKLARRPQKNMSGFTLIELMIVLVIVGILISVGYPSYQEYLRRAKRSEARTALVDGAARMERGYSNTNRYPETLAAANIATTTDSGEHTISVAVTDVGSVEDQAFTLTATASGYVDAKCATLTLTNTGTRGQTGTGSAEDCWGK